MSGPTVTDAQRGFLARTPERFRRMYLEAVTTNRRQLAIRTFCVQCTGWTPSETRECTGRGCPLWPYRLGGHPGAADADADGSAGLPVAPDAPPDGDPPPERVAGPSAREAAP